MQFLRRHYPDQVRRSVTNGHPLSQAFPAPCTICNFLQQSDFTTNRANCPTKYARRDSNSQPLGSKPSALSIELRARNSSSIKNLPQVFENIAPQKHICERLIRGEWWDLNPRSSGPQPDALTTTLHPPQKRRKCYHT